MIVFSIGEMSYTCFIFSGTEKKMSLSGHSRDGKGGNVTPWSLNIVYNISLNMIDDD